MRVVAASGAPRPALSRERKTLVARALAFDTSALRKPRALFDDASSASALASRFHDGTQVWLLDESHQETGSFKVRGAMFMLAELGAKHVVAASAGNHGAGMAYAAQALGISATIFVPRSAPEEKKKRIVELGALLVVHESDHYDDAEAAAKAHADREGVPFVSPYEDDAIAAGNGTTLARDLLALRATRAPSALPLYVLVPFGGGGLASGVAWGLPRDAFVWGAQSEASPAMAISLENNEALLRHEGAPTLADGLEGGIAEGAYLRARDCVAGVCVVTEAETANAMVWLHKAHGIRVEGSAAVSLAALLGCRDGAEFYEKLGVRGPAEIVIAITGRNVDTARFEQVLREAHGAPRW